MIYNYAGDFEKAVEVASAGESIAIQKLFEDQEDNGARMQYIRFLTHFRNDLDSALAQLDIILASEDDESNLFAEAEAERIRIIEEKEARAEAEAEAKREAEALQEDEGIELKIGE